ncbi:MAG: YlxR family protein [Oscillochloris sp.]|nr:YlxR family protein [Oscillochloris sp.]
MAQAGKKQQSAPPVKHVPQRTCIACRRGDAKRELVRLVRDSAGRVSVDPGGKARGRGAYVCRDAACWDVAFKRHAIERAFKLEQLHPEDRAALLAYRSSLEPEPSLAEATRSAEPRSAADRTDTGGS